ncbi:uncharacterized protein B0I36DRAFT_368108 [Microdochium trichocladiopsis]|uniref:MYND-type domain-containing protein n=1 Tax=Microdochium trichocladiopsis TaxID=1682393 RepID=A0A9P8XX39_9PEZI|nr:uncharacterized protein B0I36DRAFT_368108 [Microdochium trichocladiopsis]KAH7018058.1 hypothetical protein B0I36DRAFT_368108 [Microdochium trichocladiopsis]
MATPRDTGFDALKTAINDIGKADETRVRIEKLFSDLLRAELNIGMSSTQVSAAYRDALVAFLRGLPDYLKGGPLPSPEVVQATATDKHLTTQNFLASKALTALDAIDDNIGVDKVRPAFIMGLQPLFLIKDKFSTNMADYLTHCHWSCLGRQVPPGTKETTSLAKGCIGSQIDRDSSDEENDDDDEEHSDECCTCASLPAEDGLDGRPPEAMAKRLHHLPCDLTCPKKCAHCGMADPSLVCGDCAVKNNDVVAVGTGYCNADCQAQHWGQHREHCFAQRKLKTVVEVITKTLYTMESDACGITLRATRVGRDALPVAELRFNPDEVLCGGPLLRPFPWRDFPSDLCAEQVLWHGVGESMPMIQTYLVKWMLATKLDIFYRIEEYRLQVKNVPLSFIIDSDQYITTPLSHGRTVQSRVSSIATALAVHTVHRIVFRNGEDFAIDYCAPRFGWRETISRWSHFVSQRV